MSLLILGWALAVLVGLVMGLVGGGGSILTVPILVYLLGVEPVLATGYSLLVVGGSALIGAILYGRRGTLHLRVALGYALPGLLMVILTRRWLLPHLPDTLFAVDSADLTGDLIFLLLLLAGLTGFFLWIRWRVRQGKANEKGMRILALVLPAALAVFLIRQVLIPRLPDHLIELNDFALHKDTALMILFGLVMIASALLMLLRKEPKPSDTSATSTSWLLIGLQGAVVGSLTGLVGAGGGFLLVPALVLMAKLPMREAIGTSLLIIAFNSLVGFLGEAGNPQIDWPFLAGFTLLAALGILGGHALSGRIPPAILRKAFGWFVLVMAAVILTKETLTL